MKPINLLPAACAERRLRLGAARAWCVGVTALVAATCAGGALLLGGGRIGAENAWGAVFFPEWACAAIADGGSTMSSGSAAGGTPASAQTIATRTVMTRAALERERARADTLKRQLVAAGRRAALIEAVSEHPDWSRLLSLIGALKGDGLLIGALDVHASTPAGTSTTNQSAGATPASGAPRAPGSVQPGKLPAPGRVYLVKVGGSARTPAEATQFALRLESTGLFERVTLVETQPSEIAGIAATAFRIECELAERSSPVVAAQGTRAGESP